MSTHVCLHMSLAVLESCVHLLTYTHSNKNLCATVHDLNVLVLHEAAHDCDVGVALCGVNPWSLWHLSPHTARPMFAPPGVMG